MIRYVLLLLLAALSSQSFAGWQVFWGPTERTPAGFCGETMAEACTSVVNTGQGGWSYSWSGGGCQSQYTGNPPNAPITSGFSQCDSACLAGQTRYQGYCVAACVGAEVRNPQTGLCEGPCKVHPQTLACVPNCQALKGLSFMSTWGMAGSSGSAQGCSASCSAAVGVGPWAVQCTYLGTDAEEGPGTGEEGEGEGGGGEGAEGSAPEGSEEAPEDEEGEPEPCPPGTVQGYVNGKRYCAPDSGSEPSPPTNPNETDPTGLGPKVDSLRTSIENTRAAVEATGTAVNRQTALLESGLSRVVTAINAQGPNVPGGGGDGEGEGEGEGSGDCDPTAADYWDCLAGDPTALEHTEPGVENAGEVFEQFYSRVAASDIGQVGSRLSGGINVGNCPVANFQMFGQSLVIDQHCTMFESIRPVLEAIMLACWVALGIIILLSA